jgi:hypothetical protein
MAAPLEAAAIATYWFRLTADLQVIEPALSTNDGTLALGLRGKIDT